MNIPTDVIIPPSQGIREIRANSGPQHPRYASQQTSHLSCDDEENHTADHPLGTSPRATPTSHPLSSPGTVNNCTGSKRHVPGVHIEISDNDNGTSTQRINPGDKSDYTPDTKATRNNINTAALEDPFFPALTPELVAEHSHRIASFWPHPTIQAMEEFPDFCKIYSIIKSFNLPNVLGARITLQSGLNLSNWEHELIHYHDREVCAFLRYGWPLGYSSQQPPTSADTNHPSGTNHINHVKKFIATELRHHAIVGPFKDPPFFPWTRNNPIMSRPKKDSNDCRIIIDLTFPQQEGINQGIHPLHTRPRYLIFPPKYLGPYQLSEGSGPWSLDLEGRFTKGLSTAPGGPTRYPVPGHAGAGQYLQ